MSEPDYLLHEANRRRGYVVEAAKRHVRVLRRGSVFEQMETLAKLEETLESLSEMERGMERQGTA